MASLTLTLPGRLLLDQATGHVLTFAINTATQEGDFFGNGDLSLVDPVGKRTLWTQHLHTPIQEAALDPATHYALLLAYGQTVLRPITHGRILVVDLTHGHVSQVVTLPGNPESIAVDPTTGHLFLSVWDNLRQFYAIVMLDARTYRLLRTVATPRMAARVLTVDEAAHRLFVAQGTDLLRLDTRTGDKLGTTPIGPTVISIAVDEASGRAVVGLLDGLRHDGTGTALVDGRTGRLLTFMHFSESDDIAIDPARGRAVLLQYYPGRFCLVDLRTGAVRARFEATGVHPPDSWTFVTGAVIDPVTGHALVVRNRTFSTTYQGNPALLLHESLYVLDPRTGRVLATRTLSDAVSPHGLLMDVARRRILIEVGKSLLTVNAALL
jgi:DNA-binding beta-propeller fold protein YncE